MSDRRAWLAESCPECRVAPAPRCRRRGFSRERPVAAALHVARGWRQRRCPTCSARPGDPCRTPSGAEASRAHAARLSPGPRELVALVDVWAELERRGLTLATVPFSGRPGAGSSVLTIAVCRVDGGELVDVERWTGGCDELAYALEAPVWDRFGTFAGQSRVRGAVVWSLSDRSVLIAGGRGGERFEEAVA